MRLPRFRLRSLMILVFLSSLAMATWVHVRRMDSSDLIEVGQRFFLFLPFLILVAAKSGLVAVFRSRRSVAEGSAQSRCPERSARE